jgi:hypothetical protein
MTSGLPGPQMTQNSRCHSRGIIARIEENGGGPGAFAKAHIETEQMTAKYRTLWLRGG